VHPEAHAAKLQLRRATVSRADAELDVLAPITAYSSGSVDVSFRAAGETTTFEQPIDADHRRVRFDHALDRAQVRMGTGILTLSYEGDAGTRGQEVRLRAASGRADLTSRRPTLEEGLLRARGTIAERARGVVRVQLDWVSQGRRESLEVNAQVEDGRWALSERLPDAVLRSIDQRSSSLHSYILFTGYLPERMRGEMRAYQVLAAP
jgi:hypothetical protein